MRFMLLFLGLTIGYIAVFALLTATVKWVRPRLTGEPKIAFKAALQGAFAAFFSNNNRRWEYLVAMTMVTLILAFAYPGSPLLTSGIKELPSAVLGDSAQQSLRNGWDYFMHGNKAPIKAQQSPVSTGPTWFWWQAFLLYSLATFVYFFFAFWDEFWGAMKKAFEVFREHREKHQKREAEEREAAARQAAQQQRKTGQQPIPVPPPAPAPSGQPTRFWQGIGKFVTVDLIIEAIIALFREFFELRRARRVT